MTLVFPLINQLMLSQSLINHHGSALIHIYAKTLPSPLPSFPTRAFTAFSPYMMGSSTLSTLALCLAILTTSVRAQQGYICDSPTSCSDCPTSTGSTGGPYVAQMFCDTAENCFGAYQCFFKYDKNPNYGAPDTTWDSSQGVPVTSQYADCCDPPAPCNYPLTGTGEGLVDLDANGTTQSATDTTNTTAMASDNFCPVYCVDCAGGKYTSDNSIGNPIFTCDSCGNGGNSAQNRCIPPIPDTCTSASNPINAGQCRVEILQSQRESEAQDWWALNLYFYDALHVSLQKISEGTAGLIIGLMWAF